jgi:hypothetical protein
MLMSHLGTRGGTILFVAGSLNFHHKNSVTTLNASGTLRKEEAMLWNARMRCTRRVGESLVSAQDTGDITGRCMHTSTPPHKNLGTYAILIG